MKSPIVLLLLLLLAIEILDPSSPFVRVNPGSGDTFTAYADDLATHAQPGDSRHRHEHEVLTAVAHGGMIATIKTLPIPSGSFPAPPPKASHYRFIFTREIPRPPARA